MSSTPEVDMRHGTWHSDRADSSSMSELVNPLAQPQLERHSRPPDLC